MNILLVDDDAYVLEALRKTLDWKTIGIDNIYTAPSVNRAKKIIEDIPIQILICDIEMPKENGFELLKWIREKNYIIKEILLTSYAEFKYATEAIKFGCYAYALKPIDYGQLEELILGAIQEEKRALSLVNHEKYYEYWTTSIKMRKEQFFYDLLINRREPDMKAYDLKYRLEQLFLPVIVWCDLSKCIPGSDNGKGMFEWTLNNLIAEAYTTDKTLAETVIKRNTDEFLVLIQIDDSLMGEDFIKGLSENLLKKTEKKLEITCGVTIGTISALEQLSREVADFFNVMNSRLVEYGTVTVLKNYRKQSVNVILPDFRLWKNFIKSGQFETVKKEVANYLDRQNQGNNLDKDSLKKFITGVIHMLMNILNENGIHSDAFGEALFNTDQINHSIRNVGNAKTDLGQMIDIIMNMLKSPDSDKSIIQTVKEYIDNNLDKELTREALAEKVYLNQDYLARIFKKEIGESIVNYITGKRITIAKEYLEKTNESVNSVAIKVGYDNFSYFTKIFKERVGMTPKDYRSIYGITNENAAVWQRNVD
ncbi:response regulator [Anaerocolumna sp. AGMB13025]|uniref:response regulator transcription factor n=1 Tax=Anaerocolumna sp. AGMB13025 TaxID=3039116 RepID=UPI00241D0144|nr:response regulator [Anaerocolumna sp. AGMB13025]WFR57178.1 response regulator [Anaerocolumna sp. AGMB13025]